MRTLYLLLGLIVGAAAGAGVVRYVDAAREEDRSARVWAACHNIAAPQFGALGERYTAFMAGCERRFQ
ncbi:hypothetical protein [Burkholderia ubonensis]|uniref:hypothetical protein n=1 Tax=Burkholderia ubonensis TaxID=101571 RepID=UPI00075B49BB|nr:hypothetical protein [Burkholderia ubonensis]KWI10906.1 hypothetical protein WM01_19310 [Burkholderia ubonensis]OJA94459.1 hypothetical protein BGV51_28280 [Burkholderia ubonensis]